MNLVLLSSGLGGWVSIAVADLLFLEPSTVKDVEKLTNEMLEFGVCYRLPHIQMMMKMMTNTAAVPIVIQLKCWTPRNALVRNSLIMEVLYSISWLNEKSMLS